MIDCQNRFSCSGVGWAAACTPTARYRRALRRERRRGRAAQIAKYDRGCLDDEFQAADLLQGGRGASRESTTTPSSTVRGPAAGPGSVKQHLPATCMLCEARKLLDTIDTGALAGRSWG